MDERLSEEKRLLLEQFGDITNFDKDSEYEYEKVVRLLTVCNWNVETAISRYFDNDFPQLDNNMDHFSDVGRNMAGLEEIQHFFNDQVLDMINETSRDSNINRPLFEEIENMPSNPSFIQPPITALYNDPMVPKLRRAMPISNKWKFQIGLLKNNPTSPYSKLLTPIVFLLMIMPKFLLLLGYGLNKIFGNFAPKLFRMLGLREEDGDYPSKPLHNTLEEIQNYDIKKSLETHYISRKIHQETKFSAEEFTYPLHNTDFNTCFDYAKQNLKWLCIVLFNSHASTSENVMNLLTEDEFISFIKKNDIVLYVGDVSYPEPFEVGNTYKGFGLPYLTLISNVSATGLLHPEFSIVCKYNKFLDSIKSSNVKLLKKLNKVIDKYEPQLITQRYDKQEAELSRLLREQQDNAYQESLLKDIERENEKKRKQAEENEKELLKKQEEINRNTELNKRKEFLIYYINEKINIDKGSWQRGEFTTIQFRNFNGDRFINKFKSDDTSFDLFVFVEAKKLINEMEKEFTSEEEIMSYFQEYEFEYPKEELFLKDFTFDLISPLPRLKLTCGDQPLREIKELWPNGSILIENVESEDEDEEEEEEVNDYGDE